jgi:hypothetical protein
VLSVEVVHGWVQARAYVLRFFFFAPLPASFDHLRSEMAFATSSLFPHTEPDDVTIVPIL